MKVLGLLMTIREVDGGLILEAQSPSEDFKSSSVVAGRYGSANVKKTVARKFRAMLKEWLK